MAIQYDLLPLPGGSTGEGGEQRLYPKVVTNGTVSLKQMAEDISHGASYTAADVIGMVEALVDCSAKYLNGGYHVDLGPLGILSLSLACEKDENGHQPVITDPSQVKPHQLHVSKVVLNVKSDYMKRLAGPFERAKEGFPSNTRPVSMDMDERRALLLDYLQQSSAITIRRYKSLTGLSQTKAASELRMWADPSQGEPILTSVGSGPHLIFVKKG